MNAYASRKFIVTGGVIVATIVLAYHGNMDGNVAIVFAAAIGAYNLANAWVTGKGNDQ